MIHKDMPVYITKLLNTYYSFSLDQTRLGIFIKFHCERICMCNTFLQEQMLEMHLRVVMPYRNSSYTNIEY